VSALFITGTDTGVGKTFVGCALAHALRAQERRVAVMKPVETGVDGTPEDAARLRAAAADPAALDVVCPVRLRAPLAPAVAARLEGRTIEIDALVDAIARRAGAADVLLVEGAGGLLVPIAARATYLDLALRARLPVLIVAPNRLGTINHCALTARVAQAAGLDVRGFVLTAPTPATDDSAATNAGAIAELTRLPCLGILSHVASPESAAGALDVERIVGG